MADLMALIHEAGFTGQSANIMYAIVMAESGGSTRAHNGNANTGDDSYGLAQINMLGAMGPERRARYGLSSNDALYDPLTNLRIAFQMSGGGTHFGDWSTYNTGAYRQYLGQSGAPVTNTPSGASGASASSSGGQAVTGTTKDDLMGVDNLGALLDSVPELKRLVDQAVSGNWSSAKFQNSVEDSTWWKSHSDTARQQIIQQANDPAAWKQSFANERNTVSNLSHQLGMSLSSYQLDAITNNAMLTGNAGNQQWITQQISSRENYQNVHYLSGFTGQMATTIQQLQALGNDYGYQWGNAADMAAHAQGIVDGTTTLDTYKQRLTSWAESTFPGLAQQIKGGATVASLASPYMQSMSQLLEVAPGTLNLFTPAIRKAMQGTVDPATKLRAATPIWQFEDQVRQDPRWQYTQNAKDTMSTALVKIGHDFGFGF